MPDDAGLPAVPPFGLLPEAKPELDAIASTLGWRRDGDPEPPAEAQPDPEPDPEPDRLAEHAALLGHLASGQPERTPVRRSHGDDFDGGLRPRPLRELEAEERAREFREQVFEARQQAQMIDAEEAENRARRADRAARALAQHLQADDGRP